MKDKKTKNQKKSKKNTIDYVGKNKKYVIKFKRKLLSNNAKIILCIFFALALIIMTLYLYILGNEYIDKNTKKINYILNSNVDYKVYLKNNDYYKEEYLKSGMQYIASLIKEIKLDFNYEAYAEDIMNYEYKYDVSANILAVDRNDNEKVLFENTEYLVKEKKVNVNDTNFTENIEVPINYDKYNDYVIGYKKEYALNADINLIVKMNFETIGENKNSIDKINDKKEVSVIIPLSEQTFNIQLNNEKSENSGILSGKLSKNKQTMFLYLAVIGLSIISLSLIVYIITLFNVKRKDKSIYHKTISKYLKEYDRAIVTTHKSSINENTYDQVIRISSMEEMLDLHDNLELPILYYEVIKDKKSYFVIIKDNILYKLTISDAWLNENSGAKK